LTCCVAKLSPACAADLCKNTFATSCSFVCLLAAKKQSVMHLLSLYIVCIACFYRVVVKFCRKSLVFFYFAFVLASHDDVENDNSIKTHCRVSLQKK